MRRRRILILIFAAAGAVAVLVAGCGGSGSTPTGSGTAPGNIGKRAVAFGLCMRSHGVPGYPDPKVTSAANHVQVSISPGSADPNSPAFKSADHACHNLLPNGGRPANGPQNQAQNLTFADCVRSHGVPSLPDADRDGAFTLPSTINPQAPAFQHAVQACSNKEPSSLSIDQAPSGP
jgi:hypothetical protein